MSVTFTSEQQKVIDARGCNLLVSAAAGSGKTAVLTERILKLVSDEKHPVDIDRLLVVTFTNVAAAEMRERISAAIEKELSVSPENEHLQRQSALLYNAQITTIDSFCLFVIRNHFHTIGLDPGFRTMDEGERKLLLQDVLGEVLENCYKQGDEAFLKCMEYFSSGSNDRAIEDMVLRLYDYAMSHPFPREWLRERTEDYIWPDESEDENIDAKNGKSAAEQVHKTTWLQTAMSQIDDRLLELRERIGQCIKMCEEPDGPYMYGEILEREAEQIDKLLAAGAYETRQAAFTGICFGRLSSKKDESVSSQKRELVKNIRAEIKAQLQDIAGQYFSLDLETAKRHMAVCREASEALITLTIAFLDAFDAAKREKNLLDFGDMEHLALSILCKRGEDGRIMPTPTALEYRSHFAEVLIDEYQDSNLVQEYLLSVISGEEEGRYNRFMVGDVKQSIYRFRLARPELFLEKYNTYSDAEGSRTTRIDLHKNFRSRNEILTCTNTVFEQIMQSGLGGIAYDEKAALYPGAIYPPYSQREDMYDTELILFAETAREGMDIDDTQAPTDAKELEAHGIAARIRELTQSFQVTDRETGKLRRTSYKDIVILLRTASGWDEIFKRILEEEGIPVHVTSKTGYFEASEVQELLHYLRILDNPLQDIPLYGVLHSYLGGFTEEEIALVRAASPKSLYLYDALCVYAKKWNSENGRESDVRQDLGAWQDKKDNFLAEKIRIFMQRLESYRDMAVYLSVHELLRRVLSDSAYLSYVAAKPGGDRRRANVEMLLTRAFDYEKTSYYGLYHFLRYIEQLEKYDVDYGEANLQDENADVVRIMSIHKSKGLEFPICFVSGLSKSFNRRDAGERLILDADWGLGIDYVDTVNRVKSKTLRRNFLSDKLKQDSMAEELRILYVAMTRAKEKLILTGVLRRPEKKLSSLWLLTRQPEQVLPVGYILQADSFLDILLLATARNHCFDPIWEKYGFSTNPVNALYEKDMKIQPVIWEEEEILGKRIKQTILREETKRQLLYREEQQDFNKEIMTIMSDRFSYQYPYENLKELYTKTTVSELKKAGMQEETDFSFPLYDQEQVIPYLPKFLQCDEGISGMDRGSAYHKVMELFDFSLLTNLVNDGKTRVTVNDGNTEGADNDGKGKASDNCGETDTLTDMLKDSMQKMLEEGKLSRIYYDAVSVPKLVRFLQSNVAKRMAKAAAAGKLYKEQPFVLGLSARRLNDAFPEEETVLIQGIIDVFFEEDGDYVLLDYKTDAVKTPEELVNRYQVQLDYYEEALMQLSADPSLGKRKKVSEKIIYSFGLEREIYL